MKLTSKERRFCEEYVIDWNAARAARDAGYSKRSAKELGSRLLTNDNIKKYIDNVKDNLEKLCGISAARNIKELMKIAYCDASHIRESWEELKNFEDLPENVKASIESIEFQKTTFGKNGVKKTIKIKSYSKIRAIEILNQMMGYNSAIRQDVNVNKDSEVIVDSKEVQKAIKDICGTPQSKTK